MSYNGKVEICLGSHIFDIIVNDGLFAVSHMDDYHQEPILLPVSRKDVEQLRDQLNLILSFSGSADDDFSSIH